MRTGLEVLTVPADITELEDELRETGSALLEATKHIPTPDQVPPLDAVIVQDIRWHVYEALRLNRDYRRRLADRLAGATPGQSHHASTHDPPDACQSRSSPP